MIYRKTQQRYKRTRRQPIIIIYIIFIYPSAVFLHVSNHDLWYSTMHDLFIYFVLSHHLSFLPLKVLEQEQRPKRINKCLRNDTHFHSFVCKEVLLFLCYTSFPYFGYDYVHYSDSHTHALCTRFNSIEFGRLSDICC